MPGGTITMSASPTARIVAHCRLETNGEPGSSAYPGSCGSTRTVTDAPGEYVGAASATWTVVVLSPSTGTPSRTARVEVRFLPDPMSSLMTCAVWRTPCAWV